MTSSSKNRQTPDTVLVVAAHPDDETLGCGGTIANYADRGINVHLVFMTDGVSSRPDSGEHVAARRRSAEQAAEILGAKSVSFHDFPDNRMDSVALLDVVQVIEDYVRQLQPDTVMTHYSGDLNIDHSIAARAVATACRPLPDAPVCRLLAFEVPSSTEWTYTATVFQPQLFVDIETTLERKMEALRIYGTEIRPSPHARSPESVQALAAHRGHSAGLAYAEAFMVLRSIHRYT